MYFIKFFLVLLHSIQQRGAQVNNNLVGFSFLFNDGGA